MKVISQFASTIDKRRSRSVLRYAAFAILGLLSVVIFAENVKAQIYRYRAYRPNVGVVVAPTFIPGPYYGGPYIAPPIVYAPWGGVRIRTPGFSLNIGPRSYIAPRYPVYSYGYAYPRIAPLDSPVIPPAGYVLPGVTDATIVDPLTGLQYSPGFDGGIPDLTDLSLPTLNPPTPSPVSLATLRFSAETLRRTLANRNEEGEVWLNYLHLETIIAAVDAGLPAAELENVRTRFDGVVMNPDLGTITKLPGFAQTQRLLGQWIDSESRLVEPPVPVPADGNSQSLDRLPDPVPPPEPTASQQNDNI